jgi:subtilisin-like proprotein convertase family protein
VVQIEDAYGNNVASNGVPITVALNTGAFASGTTTVNSGGAGSATFSDLVINAAGNYTLTATASGIGAGLAATPAGAFTINAVNTPPTIGVIANQTVIEDQPTSAIQLVLSDDATPELSLQPSGVSDNPDLVPNENIFFGQANGHWYTTVTPAFGHKSGTATITVNVSDGTNSANTSFLLTVNPPPAGWARFYNSSAITIPANGAATPYPSVINVAGRSGTITNMTLTLSKFSHERVQDVNMLLVGPATNLVIFSHISGGNRSATNVTVHLTDAASFPLPSNFALWSEPLWPTAYLPAATFPAPAPVAAPYGTNRFAPTFNGTAANGNWSLYVYDDTAGAGGIIAGGWSLIIATDGGGSLPPQVSDITNRNIQIDTNTGPIPFTIDDGDTDLNGLAISASSSNTNLVTTNNIVFGGSDSNRTVTVTPVAGQTGTATITVMVSDGVNTASDAFVLTVSAPPTQVRVETAADGTGIVVPAQNINPNGLGSVTVFAIARDVFSNFVANVAPDAWSLTNVTGGVVSGDLVAAGDMKSATFTGHSAGSAIIHVVSGVLTPGDSGTLTVVANAPPTIAPIPDQTTLVGVSAGPFPITIGDPDTPKWNLTLSGTSSNTNLVPNANIFLYNDGFSTQSLTVTPATGQTGTATITITVSDGVSSTNTSFLLTVNPPGSGTAIFGNPSLITIVDDTNASPYPSTISVAGIAGAITNLTVTLHNMSHQSPGDVDMLLVGPTGQGVVIFSGVIGNQPMNNITFTLSDKAYYPLPPPGYVLAPGTYQPTDLAPNHTNAPHIFPAPAPAAPYASTMSAFNGVSPNGTWSLYVFDNTTPNNGAITNGWSLAITTQVTQPIMNRPTPTSTNATLSWSAIAGESYRVQYKPDLSLTNWSDLAGDVTASGTNAIKVDTTVSGTTQRFYRVQVLP